MFWLGVAVFVGISAYYVAFPAYQRLTNPRCCQKPSPPSSISEIKGTGEPCNSSMPEIKWNWSQQTHVSSFHCNLCLEDKSFDLQTCVAGCNHLCCNECFVEYVCNQMSDRTNAPLRCFEFKCESLIPSNLVWYKCVAKYPGIALKDFSMAKFDRWNSGSVDSHDSFNSQSSGSSSSSSLRTLSSLKQDMEFFVWLDEFQACQCPQCGEAIQKEDGCNHMTHRKCPKNNHLDVHFCCICGIELDPERTKFEKLSGRIHFVDGYFKDCIQAKVTRHNRELRKSSRQKLLKKGLNASQKCDKYKLKLWTDSSKDGNSMDKSTGTSINSTTDAHKSIDFNKWIVYVPHIFSAFENRHFVDLLSQECDCLKTKPCAHIQAAVVLKKRLIEPLSVSSNSSS